MGRNKKVKPEPVVEQAAPFVLPPEPVEVKHPSHVPEFTSGLIIGLLLALNGLLFLHDRYCHAGDVLVKVVAVTKTKTVVHTRTVSVDRVVEKLVPQDRIVKEAKLYRASKLDANGNVEETWEVTKCKFRVIGAQLTDKAGRTFDVRGNIKIDPIE